MDINLVRLRKHKMQDISSVVPYVVKALVGLVITGLGTLMLWPVRKVRKEWAILKETMASTHAELVLQRTNCLGSLQKQGEEQVKLLGKVSDTLDGGQARPRRTNGVS
jgi:hypothetical protein